MPKVTVPESFAVVAEVMRVQSVELLEDRIKQINRLEDILGRIAAASHQFVDEEVMTGAFDSLSATRRTLLAAKEELNPHMKGGE